MTLPEAAASLGLSRFTLAHAARRGTLEAVAVGGVWIVDEAALERYRQRSRGQPGRKAGGTATPPTERPAQRATPPHPAPRAAPSLREEESTPAPGTTAQRGPQGLPSRSARARMEAHARRMAASGAPPIKIFIGPDGALYQATDKSTARRIDEWEIVGCKQAGIPIKYLAAPERWMRDAAADPRRPRERYQPLAAHLAGHVRGDEEVFLTFAAIEAILGFALPPARKRPRSGAHLRIFTPNLWAMAGWEGWPDTAAGGVRFRRGGMAAEGPRSSSPRPAGATATQS